MESGSALCSVASLKCYQLQNITKKKRQTDHVSDSSLEQRSEVWFLQRRRCNYGRIDDDTVVRANPFCLLRPSIDTLLGSSFNWSIICVTTVSLQYLQFVSTRFLPNESLGHNPQMTMEQFFDSITETHMTLTRLHFWHLERRKGTTVIWERRELTWSRILMNGLLRETGVGPEIFTTSKSVSSGAWNLQGITCKISFVWK